MDGQTDTSSTFVILKEEFSTEVKNEKLN